MRETELRFHTLFEQTPVGVVVVDATSGSIIEVNRQAAIQLGYTPKELCGLNLSDVEASHSPVDVASYLQSVSDRGQDQYETRHRTKSGDVRDVFVSAQLLELTGRSVIHSVFLDITERKLAEAKIRENEAHLLDAQRIAKMGSWELDLASQHLRWSDQIFQIFELSRADFRDAHYDHIDLVHVDDRERLEAARRAASLGETRLDLEYRIILPEGGEKTVHELGYLRRDERGVPVALAGTLHDITDRIRIAAEQEKRHRAETADRIKSAFLATMSHELRTPLNSIIGFTGIMLQGLAGPINDEQNKQLEMVRRSARHLLALVNDVLDISKIEAGQLEVAQVLFDPEASIEKVLALVQPQIELKRLELRVRMAPEVGTAVSDERRFEQILLNLLSNAIKFTEHGHVDLAAKIVTTRGTRGGPTCPMLHVKVSDTGMGIKSEDLPTLFQPFRQIDTGLSRRHEGTGLGLAICRRLAVLLGGEIQAESEWGRGSSFTLILPVKGRTTT